MDRLRLLAITGGGSGLSPLAPGTAGSAAAATLWWLAALACGDNWLCLNLTALTGAAGASLVCVGLSPWAIRHFGQGDPRPVVADEWAGQWVALLVLPGAMSVGRLGLPASLLLLAGLQFVLFRVMDVLKPWPCRRLERLPLGWGILLDDIVAGLYACILGQLLIRLVG